MIYWGIGTFAMCWTMVFASSIPIFGPTVCLLLILFAAGLVSFFILLFVFGFGELTERVVTFDAHVAEGH